MNESLQERIYKIRCRMKDLIGITAEDDQETKKFKSRAYTAALMHELTQVLSGMQFAFNDDSIESGTNTIKEAALAKLEELKLELGDRNGQQ